MHRRLHHLELLTNCIAVPAQMEAEAQQLIESMQSMQASLAILTVEATLTDSPAMAFQAQALKRKLVDVEE